MFTEHFGLARNKAPNLNSFAKVAADEQQIPIFYRNLPLSMEKLLA